MTQEKKKRLMSAIWSKGAELGLYDKKSSAEEKKTSELYIIIQSQTGKSGMTACTDAELMKVLDYLKLIEKHEKVVKSNGMITDSQEWRINRLVEELGWNDNPKRLEAYILKIAKKHKLIWLTKSEASDVIQGLEGTLKGVKKQE